MLDRAFYRDRYDYRRALVGFARDLNSDLDLHRLSERLVSRVVETLVVDRMALMLEDEAAPYYGSVRASGFGDSDPPALPSISKALPKFSRVSTPVTPMTPLLDMTLATKSGSPIRIAE